MINYSEISNQTKEMRQESKVKVLTINTLIFDKNKIFVYDYLTFEYKFNLQPV